MCDRVEVARVSRNRSNEREIEQGKQNFIRPHDVCIIIKSQTHWDEEESAKKHLPSSIHDRISATISFLHPHGANSPAQVGKENSYDTIDVFWLIKFRQVLAEN